MGNIPREPALLSDVAEFALSVEDVEQLKAQAAVLRASVAGGGQPMWRAQTLAQAIALENIAAEAIKGSGNIQPGNGGELIVRVPLDASWKEQEIARATSDPPDLVTAKASVERLTLVQKANALVLAVDAAERSGASSPAEQIVAHQLASSHVLTMKLVAKSQMFLSREYLAYKPHVGDGGEAAREQVASIEASRLATAAARLMEASARAALVLDRLRNGIRQTIVVQQKVEVQPGAQAMVNGAVQIATGRTPE